MDKKKSEQAKRREALEALRALGYWDFVTIGQALEMGIDHLSKIDPETRSINCQPDPEYLEAVKGKVDRLMEKARQLFA